jgi:hypothetical protein
MTTFKEFLVERHEKPQSWVYKGKANGWLKEISAWHGTGISFKDEYDPRSGIRYTVAMKNGKRMGVYHHGKHMSYAGGAVDDDGSDGGSVGSATGPDASAGT